MLNNTYIYNYSLNFNQRILKSPIPVQNAKQLDIQRNFYLGWRWLRYIFEG